MPLLVAHYTRDGVPLSETAPVEVERTRAMDRYYDLDTTSDYAESFSASEFASIKTNRLLYLYEHGRYVVYICLSGFADLTSRYQGVVADRYGLPNDEAEQLREGIKHRLYLDHILKGDYFLAPIGERPQKIVDLGTGTGMWALEGEAPPFRIYPR